MNNCKLCELKDKIIAELEKSVKLLSNSLDEITEILKLKNGDE